MNRGGGFRARSWSTSTDSTPMTTAGAGPSSAIASTSARNEPEMRWTLWRTASRSLPMASTSSTAKSSGGSQSALVESIAAIVHAAARTATSPAMSLVDRLDIDASAASLCAGGARVEPRQQATAAPGDLGSELRARAREAAGDPGGVVAVGQPGAAEVELERDRLERVRAFGVELDEEEQAEVVAQPPVDRVVVDEVAEVVEDAAGGAVHEVRR